MSIGECLWDLLGTWSGVEELRASPSGPAARTRAMLTLKQDLAGAAVVEDYRQIREDGGEFLAHGVFLADEDAPEVVLWWLFDSAAHVPRPARGGWAGPVLELTRTSPRGAAYHRFELAEGRLGYAIDLALGGAERVPFLRGRYERVSGH